MCENCHKIEEMGALAELPAGDPGLDHVARCAQCRGLLAAYRRFETGCPEAGDPARERALSEFLTRKISAPAATGQSQPHRQLKRFQRFLTLAPGLAVAAVLVLFLSLREYRTTLVPELSRISRGDTVGATAPLELLVGLDTSGDVTLSWNALPGADHYQVVVYGADLQELARLEAGGATTLGLAAEQLGELRQAPLPLIWRVLALAGGNQLAISDPAIVPDDGS